MLIEWRFATVVAAAALGFPLHAAAQDPGAQSLAGEIRGAVARLRPQAATDLAEAGVVATVADIIVTAGVAPPLRPFPRGAPGASPAWATDSAITIATNAIAIAAA